jgi:trk system potassium uptake protein TrkH
VNGLRKTVANGGYYAKLTMLIGALIATPAVVPLFYPDEARYIFSFLAPAVVTVAVGTALCFVKTKEKPADEWQSPLQRGSLPVMFAWCVASALGAIPFTLAGQLKFFHALFESVSGWTTTGLTLADVAKMPRVFLFYRAFMQYCGGAGFILMIITLVQGRQAVDMYNAEGHSDRLAPNIKRTARTVFQMYGVFSLLGVALYIAFGMAPFDAVCHAMSALSTAGFTSAPGGIGGYNNLGVEAVTILLMLIGASNFAALLMFVKRKFKKALRVSEMRFMFVLILLFTPAIALSLIFERGAGLFEAARHSLFGVVTLFSTTGYSTMDYALWPHFAVGLMFILMVIGGGAGSTAGGVKLSRAYLLVRAICENVKKRVRSARRVTVPFFYRAQGKTAIDGDMISDTCVFILIYVITAVIGTLLLTITEKRSLIDSAFEFTSALSTVGVSNGITSVNASAATLIVEMIGMLLGRLEVLIVFVGIYSGFRAARKKITEIKAKRGAVS